MEEARCERREEASWRGRGARCYVREQASRRGQGLGTGGGLYKGRGSRD